MVLSMTFNEGTGLLTNPSNSQTKRWFETGGYKNIEYSKFVLGDITSGGKTGAKNRKADELEILMGIDYDKKTDDYDRIKSESGESIWNRPDKIDELAEIWEDSLEYKDEKTDVGNS